MWVLAPWLNAFRGRLLLLGIIVLLPVPGAAQDSVYSAGLFELGDAEAPPGFPGVADILLGAEQAGPDWEDLIDAEGHARDSDGNGIADYRDLYGGSWAMFEADDVSLGAGFESTALSPDGRVANATAEADHDLGNVYFYTTADSAGNLVLFAAAERLGGGDSHLEIELNQAHIRLGHGGYGRGEPWELVGDRVLGDVLIRMEFVSGALGVVEASAWDGSAWIGLTSVAGEGCNGEETLCAICNGSAIDGGPWPNHDTGGDPEVISAGRFVEVGLNVGAVLDSPVEFATIRLRTPQDTAFGYFGEEN